MVAAQIRDWEEPAFDLQECALNATHILLVDSTGRVQEVWKGNAEPGEFLPIDRFRNSHLTRLQLKGSFEPIPNLFGECNGIASWPPKCNQFILFLVRSERTDDATRFLEGWLPASRDGWFASSVAYVGIVGNVFVQPRPAHDNQFGIPDTGGRDTIADFKNKTLASMRRPCDFCSGDALPLPVEHRRWKR